MFCFILFYFIARETTVLRRYIRVRALVFLFLFSMQ